MSKQAPPVYFAVLEAARRDPSKPVLTPGHYTQLHRDDPTANEFRAYFHQEHGMRSIPLGSDREHAENMVASLNTAYRFGIVQAGRMAENPKASVVLVGRMGHINRNEESMP